MRPNEAEARSLIGAALEAAALAYVPYSGFRVGAVAITEDGSHLEGSNVENAAYPATICAEANLIGTASAAGHRSVPIVAVASLDGQECYPCGNCRQVMREFGVEYVVVRGARGKILIHTLDELLPHSFGPEHLHGGGPEAT
jgi:cytidine deaminase